MVGVSNGSNLLSVVVHGETKDRSCLTMGRIPGQRCKKTGSAIQSGLNLPAIDSRLQTLVSRLPAPIYS